MWGNNGGSRGAPGTCPLPAAQNVLNLMQFFAKFGKIICWRPLEGWRPLLLGIQDPPPGKGTKFLNFLLVVQVLNRFPCYNVISIINSQFLNFISFFEKLANWYASLWESYWRWKASKIRINAAIYSKCVAAIVHLWSLVGFTVSLSSSHLPDHGAS